VNASSDDPYAAMLRGAAVPTAVAGALAVVLASFSAGPPGFLGALLALLVVVAFFAASLMVMRATARAAPQSVLAAALLCYLTKVGLLGLLAVLLRDAAWLSANAFALTAVGCAGVWLAFEIRAFARLRILVAPDIEPDAGAGTPR
jgi:ATP synthase protein I